jgi:hypothetical protein
MKELNSFAQQWLDETPSVITGEPMIPEPSFLSKLAQPFVSFGEKAFEGLAADYENFPARLFSWGMDKLGGSEKRTVQQGAGTSTTYLQPRNPGGAPAATAYTVLQPGQGGGGIVPAQTAGLSTLALVGIGLVILLAVRK